MNQIIDFCTALPQYTLWGFTLDQLLSSFIVILLTLFLAKFFKSIVIQFFKKQAAKTNIALDDELLDASETPIRWLIVIAGIYCGVLILHPVDSLFPLKTTLDALTESAIAIILTWLCFRLVDVFDSFITKFFHEKNQEEEQILLHFFPLIKKSIKVVIAIIAIIIIIQNRGYSVTSLIAGFGITGLAVGFAAKESIANIFGSFFLIVDKAYKVGDWIIVDKAIQGNNAEGIVEDISLRSTKIRAFDNTLIIIPNNVMANATINNVSRHKKRRIFEYLDITYDTPPEKVEQAVMICRNIVSNHPEMEQYQQIHFNQFGPHSLKIMLYIFTKTTDWGEYLRIRQELFLSILKEFNAAGIEFAFPTQTLFVTEQHPSK